jgi:hypothetical protein
MLNYFYDKMENYFLYKSKSIKNISYKIIKCERGYRGAGLNPLDSIYDHPKNNKKKFKRFYFPDTKIFFCNNVILGHRFIKKSNSFFPFISHEFSMNLSSEEAKARLRVNYYKKIKSKDFKNNYEINNSYPSFFISILRQFRIVKKTISTPVFSLVSPDSKGYYHWIIEELPKLKYFENFIRPYQKNVKILIDASVPKWKVETLNLLGYSYPSDFIHHDELGAKYLNFIYCSPIYYNNRSMLSRKALIWLKNKMLKQIKNKETSVKQVKRIYITRSDAKSKKIINEIELIKELKKYGFKIYKLSTMNFIKKIKLFYQAEIIVGSHGAGLLHSLFSENCKIIELFSERNKPNMYHALSIIFKNSYSSIVCENSLKSNTKDIFVNIKELLNIIKN